MENNNETNLGTVADKYSLQLKLDERVYELCI